MCFYQTGQEMPRKKGTEIDQCWAGKRQESHPRCQGNNHLPCVVMEAMWWWGGLQIAWSLGYKDSRRQIKLPNLPYLIPTCWELYKSQSLLQFYIPPWVWNMKAIFPLTHTGVITVMPSVHSSSLPWDHSRDHRTNPTGKQRDKANIHCTFAPRQQF